MKYYCENVFHEKKKKECSNHFKPIKGKKLK